MDVTSTLYLLTAPRGAGKTTFCHTLADKLRAAGWDVAGLLSPAVFEDGIKTGIDAQDLRTGESRPLARLSTHNLQPATFTLQLGQWLFDPSAFNWGNQILETSLPCGLLIVDEIGPLELYRGNGWVSALETLRQPHYRLGIVVIRPECIGDFSKLGIPFQVKGLSTSQAILGELLPKGL